MVVLVVIEVCADELDVPEAAEEEAEMANEVGSAEFRESSAEITSAKSEERDP